MTETFTPTRPIWCAGCGDFGVLEALTQGLDELAVPAYRRMIIAGIGCSGSLQNYLSCYGYHALHGRVLPTATGCKLANPDLTVVAVGGDGDGYAIGGGHLVHAFKRNPGITYIVMNNGTYGLTKGQASPTSTAGFRGNIEEDLDPVLLALSIPGSTFIARAYSGQPAQLLNLTIAALKHTAAGYGMAYLEVLSPCVTYNDTYREWRTNVYNIDDDADYDRKDRAAAFTRMIDLREQGRLPLGLIYEGERPALEKLACNPAFDPPARQDISDPSLVDGYREALQSFIK
ncbi:MAG TPA: 2-oxoacid:ferredoxin oxidoreductase subunit beta [Gammaproteobacteria bacterium]|jgi:2-oxoglutarate ferredoxin oxidoreductase subunit beta|uniref:2-oxoglutarate oxidoreductase, beta subunit n=1 Tax=hydrothermal vent metagenome TaxID=652676 RepID=A0A160TY12_9ZZZZ|nr:thiamine pyrophosphate-dependent enzyme [Gammaproteobacteria bacterium]MDE0971548.1 thiamine pyrophosphate-dependent enzyme [Arenicellales bacterium]HIF79886.1 2-oxoacid:ferredoxin oxidoreductase subunit beta [Gammaproteobacteria bacterium]HIM06340.1 2-oxoacid:ferredoxin oxidoreductase subunit beta [Gammaproteobacteria bacterium]|tara:strand:+ start:5683 stop:6546 length:864 start_codon:yes stop_codon:yes gene_type:complete